MSDDRALELLVYTQVDKFQPLRIPALVQLMKAFGHTERVTRNAMAKLLDGGVVRLDNKMCLEVKP